MIKYNFTDQAGCLENTLLEELSLSLGSGRVERKPCGRLSGHGSSTSGEESEAWNRAAFDSLGQKQRAFEPLCLSLPYGFLDTQPDPIHIADVRKLSNFYNDL